MLRITGFLWLFGTCMFFCTPGFTDSRDSTSITIRVVHNEPLKVTGSAFDENRKLTRIVDIQQKNTIPLGSFAMQSNTNCDISFKSKNNFTLKHATLPNERLANYRVSFDGEVVNEEGSVSTNCNFVAKDISLKPSKVLSRKVKQGYYEDTLSMVITTP